MKESFAHYALLAALTALSLLIFGYNFGTDPNLAQVLPFVHRLTDPSLYPGDPFLDSLSAFPSLYPYAAALLGRLLPLEPLHLAAYVAARFLFLALVFALAENLTASRRSAYFAAILAAVGAQMVVLTPLGEDPLLKTAMSQSTLAGLVCAFSLLMFLRKRYAAAFAALGASLFINALPALYLSVMYVFALPGAPDARAMRRGWAVFAVFAAAAGGWLLTLHNPFGGAGPEYSRLLKSWYPGHYFVSGWSSDKWLRAAAFIPLNLLLIYRGLASSPEKKNVRRFMNAFYVMWASALAFGELLPVPRLVSLQFFRSDAFFCLLGAVFAGDFLLSLFRAEEPGGWALGALLALSLIEPGPGAYPVFALALLAAHRHGPAWGFRAAALAGAAFCLFTLLSPETAQPRKFTVMLLLFGVAALAGKGFKSAIPPRSGALLTAAAVLIPYLPVINYRVAARSLGNSYGETENWVELQRWAGENTPRDTVFIVPPDTYGFRVFSLRSPVVEWLDAGAMHWAPGFEENWKTRIADMGAYSPEGAGRGYSALSGDRLAALGAKYGASYAVRRASAPLSFRAVYSNMDFVIYALPGERTSPHRL